ncbi:hypothetical protein [Streptomyces mayonensis]|uniref:hypothetical protein n=1 Tax=Streptomyces mayonensis TaxID=2750816 RepID=UPI001C1DE5F3|nr:hypothetical protein [Streptomyces sp. A108]MBU6535498.1 hypothetical protein [Streptomyces sp. A108]
MSRADDGGRSRWFGRRGGRSRWFGGRGGRDAEAAAEHGDLDGGGGEPLLVEEYDGIRLLRTPSDDTLGTSDIAELARALAADADTATVLTGADAPQAPDLWPRLGGILDELRDDGIRTVRLVMPAAGDDRLEAPALARLVADAWQLEVVAPDGLALVVPGGGLFVPARSPRAGGDGDLDGNLGKGLVAEEGSWWRFRPGSAEPARIGPRQPAPDWQPAVELLPARVGGGTAIGQIPAGVLAYSGDVSPPGLGDLCYAVPADPHVLTVLLGVPGGGEAVADDLVQLLSALPEPARRLVRLAPGGHRDVLPTAQAVSDALGTEVTACTGMPLLTNGTAARSGVHAMVLGADGSPRWSAFVDEVRCRPAGTPQLLRWNPPVTVEGDHGRVQPDRGVIHLSENWQVAVTRAGLWVTETEGQRPPVADRPADPGGPVIEVGRSGQVLDESLASVLDTLLSGLGADVRGKARLRVYGESTDGGRALRRLTAEHALRAIRFDTAVAGSQPSPPIGRETAPLPESEEAPSDTPGKILTDTDLAPAPATDPDPDPDPDEAPYKAPEPAPPLPARPQPTEGAYADPESAAESAPGPESAAEPDLDLEPVADPDPAFELAESTPAPPQPPEPPTTSSSAGRRRPAVVVASSGPLPAVPFLPGHVSSATQRSAFRRLAEESWERHSAAVTRALTRMPALRGPELEEARDDLIALHAYLHTTEGPLSHAELARSLRAGEERVLPYAACVASALRRLPSYRGPAFRGADGADEGLVPGNLVRDAGPVGGLPLWPGGPRPVGPQYVIWSATGRRVRELAGGPGPSSKRDKIIFAPGTLLRVLDVREEEANGAPLVLLREAATALEARTAGAVPQSTELDDHDRTVLGNLDQTLRGHSLQQEHVPWPPLCEGLLGREAAGRGEA